MRTPFCSMRQDAPSEVLSEGKANFLVSPACLELGRRHAEHVGRFLIEAPAGIVAGVVDRLGNATALASPREL